MDYLNTHGPNIAIHGHAKGPGCVAVPRPGALIIVWCAGATWSDGTPIPQPQNAEDAERLLQEGRRRKELE